MHARATAAFGDGGDEAGRLLHHASGALDAGFENNARGAIGFSSENGVERGEGLGRVRLVAADVRRRIGLRLVSRGPPPHVGGYAGDFARTLNVNGCRNVLRGKQPRGEAFVEPAAVADGHRAEGVAVVAAGQADDAAFLGLAGELPVLE